MEKDDVTQAPTLRDLANELGLSKSTIHRALSKKGYIKEETRKRVQEAAKKLGYRPDLYFSTLSNHRKKQASPVMLLHYLYGHTRGHEGRLNGIDISEELKSRALDYGLEVERVDLSKFPKPEMIPKILYERGSNGFLLSLCDQDLHAPLKQFGKVPIVCCQRQESLPFHTVRFGVSGAVRLCWQKLWDAGYRRIGFALALHDPFLQDDYDRLGTALALMARNLPLKDQIPPLQIKPTDKKAFRRWLKEYQPDAVISFYVQFWDLCINNHGNPIPFVSLHAVNKEHITHIPGTFEPWDVLAKESLRLMSSLIRTCDIGIPQNPVHVINEPVWHEGQGIPPVK